MDTRFENQPVANTPVLDLESSKKADEGTIRNSWRRDTESELGKSGTTWTQIERTSQDRARCINVVNGLRSSRSDGPK